MPPFVKGDPRINRKGRPRETPLTKRTRNRIRELAEIEAEKTMKRLSQLRDQDEDLAVAYRAGELLAAYAGATPPAPPKEEAPPPPEETDSNMSNEELERALLGETTEGDAH